MKMVLKGAPYLVKKGDGFEVLVPIDVEFDSPEEAARAEEAFRETISERMRRLLGDLD